jgi:tetratricopeptide (TPR) repeat protein
MHNYNTTHAIQNIPSATVEIPVTPQYQGDDLLMEDRYFDACLLLEQNKLDEAIEMFNSILKQNEGCYMSLNKLGIIYIKQNNSEKATECFKKALEIQPNHAPAIVNLGNQAQEQGDSQTALYYYREAIDIDESYHMAYYNMAVTYKTMGNLEEYFKYFKQYKEHYKQHLNIRDKGEVAILRSKALKFSGIVIAILLLFFVFR